MNSAQPHSATWCSSPRLISVIMHTWEAVFISPKKTIHYIKFWFVHFSLSLVTVYRLSKSGWLSVCISDEMGTQQQKNEALLWNSASGVSASCLDCSVLWSGCVIWTTVQYECRGREYYLICLRVEWTCHGITHTHAHSLILVSWRLILSHRNRLRMKSYITRWFSLIRTMLQTYLQFRSIQWDVCEHNSKGSVNSCSTSLAAT